MHAAVAVGLKVDSTKGADINTVVVGSSEPLSGHRAFVLPLRVGERMNNMFSPCCPGGHGHAYMSKQQRNSSSSRIVCAANVAEIGNGRR